MNGLIHQSKMFLKRSAPTILTCIGGAGVIATSIMAVKATPKALKLIEDAKKKKKTELTTSEVVKTAGPVYIPAILMGVSTIACIFGANALNKHQQAALMSAYALLDNSYKEYKKQVIELYGENADADIREAVAKSQYEDKKPTVDDDKELFYDCFSSRYFESTVEDVLRAEHNLNRKLVMNDYVYLNDFYDELGIPHMPYGYKFGWTTGGNMDLYWQSWVDFTHETVPLDDNMECHLIIMRNEPCLDFENYS